MATEANRRRPWRFEWWHYVAIAFLFLLLQLMFAIVPRVWPGKMGMVFWYFGSDPIIWWAIALLLCGFAFATSVFRRPFFRASRCVGLLIIASLAILPFTYQTYPSGNADKISQVRFRVPFDEPVTIFWGGNTQDVNYHVVAPDQRWAYDIVVIDDEDRTARGDGKSLEDYYIYDRPVLAPAFGAVMLAINDEPDMPIGELGGGTDPGGNQIVLRVADGEYLFLCHLKPGSVRVKKGDVVVAGREIARVGNSGNTSEPHLHIDLQDDVDFGEGLPLYFYGYTSDGKYVERGMPRGGFEIIDDDIRLAGETIEHVPQSTNDDRSTTRSTGTSPARTP
ncbi:MAG: M23 family metallopeptidase [Planctomycetota bacterium]|nr:M23 family metallopeptidase [Planctomycetota bacterium]